MSNPSMVIVLLEDDHHEMLIRRYLVNSGLKRHAMRIHRSPSGHGSAESWVLKRFAEETGEYRRRQARAGTALIVMIDADTHSVQDRLTQLDQALKDSGIKTVGKSERIARLVPRRNVETWILCLNGEAVNEEIDYKGTRNDWSELIPRAAQTLCHSTRPQAELPNQCVDSLRSGVQDLKRLAS